MMSPAENKRAKRRKNKKIRSDHRNSGAEAHPNIPLDCLGPKLENRVLDDLGELEPTELSSDDLHEIRCFFCNSVPPEPSQLLQLRRGLADGCEDGEENVQDSLNMASQLPWYICPSCKNSSDASVPGNGYGEYLPLSFVAETEDVGGEDVCPCKSCFEQSYFSELSKKSVSASCPLGLDSTSGKGSGGSVVGGLPHLPLHLQRDAAKEEDLKLSWQELKLLVHQVYREAGLTLGDALTTHLPSSHLQNTALVTSDHRIKDIVCSLCHQDPHKLYVCLESQVKMFVVEMRLKLLMQAGGGTLTGSGSAGSGGPTKPFVCLMLEEYAKLCSAAAQVAPYLEELETTHLKGFKLTWELVNRHLFQSIVYDDPLLHSQLTSNLSQHRGANSNGSISTSSHDKCHHDSFSAVTKFDDEMTVLSVLWREAEQLIEAYNQGQAARAKQGLELLHAQMKQLMEEELNLSLFQSRYPMECQKQCSHVGGLKGHCTKSSTASNFLSPSELVSLAEQADGHVTSLVNNAPQPPSPSLLHSMTKENNAMGSSNLTGGYPSICMKPFSFYEKMIKRQNRFFSDPIDGYQNSEVDCLVSDLGADKMGVLPSALPLPSPPATPSLPLLSSSLGEALAAGGCCRLQQNGLSDLGKQMPLPGQHNIDFGAAHSHQPLQTPKTSASFKGGGLAASREAADVRTANSHPSSAASSNINSGPDSKGGCECHSCTQQQQQQQHHGHNQSLDSHLAYEGGAKLRDLSPNLLTGLKSVFAEACGSPSALAAVKQLIHPHLYKAHNNNNNNNNSNNNNGGSNTPLNISQRNSKALPTAPLKPTIFSEPFDLKFEMQGILREQIRLATVGDWDYDGDDARSLFLHHYQNGVTPHRTVSGVPGTTHFDLPTARQLPPLPPPPSTNVFFPPISLEETGISHPVLRSSLPQTPPGVCQACKIDSEGSPPRVSGVGENVTNLNVINNLGQMGRKPVCQQGKVLAATREMNGFVPDGYGSVDCKTTNGRQTQNSNFPATPPNGSMVPLGTGPLSAPVNGSGVVGGLPPCSIKGGNCSSSSSNSSLSSVGTADRGVGGHGCCEGHVPDGGEESGPDDSCSERSSSTSTSNQRESRVCDCCYCEVFGHGVPVVAPVSRNYPEMRDRLRLRLSKRKAEGNGGSVIINTEKNEPLEDSRALEELLKFINGTEEEKNKQRKGKRKGPKRGDPAAASSHQEQLMSDVALHQDPLPDLLRGLLGEATLTTSTTAAASAVSPASPTTAQLPKQSPPPPPLEQPVNQKTRKGMSESQGHAPEPSHLPTPAVSCSAEQKGHRQTPLTSAATTVMVSKAAKHQQNSSSQESGTKLPDRSTNKGSPLPTKQKQMQDQSQHLQTTCSGPRKPFPCADKMVNGNNLSSSEMTSLHHFHQEKSWSKDPRIQSKMAFPSCPDKPSTLVSASVAVEVISSNQVPVEGISRTQNAQELPRLNRNQNGKGQKLPSSAEVPTQYMNGSLLARDTVTSSTCSAEAKTTVRSKKNKKKKNGVDDGTSPDDVFMPKDIDLENGELDEFEKELEAFKRFCFNSVPLAKKEKVHVNLKDIVVKKKGNTGNGMALSNGHKF